MVNQKLDDLLGNPSKKARQPSPVESYGEPICPEYLDAYARTVWGRVLKAMPDNFFTAADAELLAAYCAASSMMHKAIIIMNKDGIVYDEEKNAGGMTIKRHPASSVLNDALGKMSAIGARLGLDPAARQAISTNAQQKEKSEFSKLLNGKSKVKLIDVS